MEQLKRTLTERISKRIRRGQSWNKSEVTDKTILEWAQFSARMRQLVNQKLNLDAVLSKLTAFPFNG